MSSFIGWTMKRKLFIRLEEITIDEIACIIIKDRVNDPICHILGNTDAVEIVKPLFKF